MCTISETDTDNKDASRSKVNFYNLRVDVLDRKELFRELRHSLSKDQTVSVNFLNAHCFNIAQKNIEYKNTLDKCTFLLNDGVGINIAGKLVGIRFKENMNGTDLIPDFFDFFARNGLTVFCFGAKKEVIKTAVSNIEAKHPGLSIVGYSDGYVEDLTSVVDKINHSRADAVILGLGVPLQELWVANYSDRLTSANLLVCGGAVFDFISGNVIRGPNFIRRIKLEWLFRLVQEPRRLFSRYILGGFVFLYNIIVNRR